MKTKTMETREGTVDSVSRTVAGMLPPIRILIEEARHRAVTAANLSMVTLYWNIGRVICTEIQSQPGRAGYGEALLSRLGDQLSAEYGRGFSRANLQDMRRFYEAFEICQPVAGKSAVSAIRQPTAGKCVPATTRRQGAAECGERLQVDFSKHYHLGWTHYRKVLNYLNATGFKLGLLVNFGHYPKLEYERLVL